jgi:Protein of unknown function (DUF3179)
MSLARLLLAPALAAGGLVGTGVAQEATNRDQSEYTLLKPEGFPIRAQVKAVPASEAGLRDDDVVIGVVIGGEARAYPVNLMWEPVNEVLNDTLGGAPITATWCPVAHSAAIYDRSLDGQSLELGAVGLRQGVFILYDRATRSWWSQVVGRAVEGPHAGRTLAKRASTVTTWAAWRRAEPQTTVFWDPQLPGRRRFTEESLSRITLAGKGPIVNADLVVGLEGAKGGARAYLVRALAAAGGVANDTLDGEPLVVVLARDAVTVNAWLRRVDGRSLTFEGPGSQVRDRETGSAWDMQAGRAVSGALAGRALEERVLTPALWYAWRSQRPDTSLWEP